MYDFERRDVMENPRELALKSLIKAEESSVFSNIEINTTLSRAKLDEKDAGLYTILYLGVLENKMLLDYIIKRYSSIPLDKIEIKEKSLLRLGIYQLYFLTKIPDYSATDECVRLAPKKSKGFINAILRSFIRDGKRVKLPDEKWEHVSIKHSFPMPIIELFISSYGEKTAFELITSTKASTELCLRVNTLKASANAVLDELKNRGASPKLSLYADDIIKCSIPISKIQDIISDGIVFIQDESSRVCTKIIDAQPNEKIADVCACPGGKTFSMALDMQNKGQIFASDLHESKLSLITKTASRLGIDIISTRVQNAKELVLENVQAFDRVLCDVPCSGLGIIFKKPDIKYKDINGINNLPSVQKDILSTCASYVKPDGVLVYSTCTLNKAENEDNVKAFLKENSGFEPVDFKIGNVQSVDGMYTFLPHKTNTDGFFVAKMKRVK